MKQKYSSLFVCLEGMWRKRAWLTLQKMYQKWSVLNTLILNSGFPLFHPFHNMFFSFYSGNNFKNSDAVALSNALLNLTCSPEIRIDLK